MLTDTTPVLTPLALGSAQPDSRRLSSPRSFHWLLVCFTCSGMSGLIYEVAWVRSLELIFGATTFAVATVLAAFMGGLAGGSYFMGKLAHRFKRFHPLRVYALMECLIAAVALLIPLLLQSLTPVYQYVWQTWHASFVTFSLVRFALAALLLLVPTFLMGATLPVVSSFVRGDAGLRQKRIGLLYTFNTVGAVLGCVGAGLILFPAIGLARTQWVAVAFNLIAAAGAFALSAKSAGSPIETVSDDEPESARVTQSLPARQAHLLVAIYACSGFVAMLYEVAWSRVLVLVLGSSTYAYTIMLATFLAGLALGAGFATRFSRSTPLLAAGLCQLVIGLATYLGLFLVEELPFFYLKAYEFFNPSAPGLLGIQFSLAAALMILPTLGLGAMFPITLHGLNPSGQRTARVVGWAYALNTVGAIAGSVLAGFWLVPHWGTQHTMTAGIAINAGLAVAALLAVKTGPLARHRLVLVLLAFVFGLSIFHSAPKWQPATLSSGVFRYVKDYVGLDRAQFLERARKISGEILMFDEGLTCTVTICRGPDSLGLLVNGKPDASTPSNLINPFDTNAPLDLRDLPTQTLLGQVPLLLAPQRNDVLVIGLGSGVTVGSVLTHPVKQVEVIELEAAVVRGSRFFDQFNGRPLADPRTQLIVNDARNHLLVTDREYDVIISEPSNPWIPGAANLFTREFFDLAKSKLRPDGVFCQWIQLYELQESHFQSILRTFSAAFPEAHVFQVKHDAIIVGSMTPRRIRPSELLARLTPAVQVDLARIRVNGLDDFLAYYWIGGPELKQRLAPAPFNTDDNMLIEFAAPLQILADPNQSAVARKPLAGMFDGATTGLIPHLDAPAGADGAAYWAALSEAAVRQQAPARALAYSAHSLKLASNPQAAQVHGSVLALLGERDKARAFFADMERQFPTAPELLRALAKFHSQEGRWKEARQFAERLLAEAPDDPLGKFCLGRSLYYLGETKASLAVLASFQDRPNDSSDFKELPFYLGALHWALGNYREAARFYEIFLRRDPTHADARAQYADALYRLGRSSEAAAHWRRLAQLNSSQAGQLWREAQAAWRSGQTDQAATKMERARELDPWNADLVLMLARLRELRGDVPGAARLLEEYLAWNPDRPPALGYLSQLLVKQNQPERAQAVANRYHALTGEAWVNVNE